MAVKDIAVPSSPEREAAQSGKKQTALRRATGLFTTVILPYLKTRKEQLSKLNVDVYTTSHAFDPTNLVTQFTLLDTNLDNRVGFRSSSYSIGFGSDNAFTATSKRDVWDRPQNRAADLTYVAGTPVDEQLVEQFLLLALSDLRSQIGPRPASSRSH